MNNFWEEKKWLNLKKTDWIALAITGAILLIIALPTGTVEGNSVSSDESVKEAQQKNIEESEAEEYISRLEEKLKVVLRQMEGVGEVEVMITPAEYEEDAFDKDVLPKIEGVVVVAEGGGNSMVVSNISKAAMALFDVEAHKIMVVKMNSKGD